MTSPHLPFAMTDHADKTAQAAAKLAALPPEQRNHIEQMLEKVKNPVWRLHNLYRIIDKHGREIPFVPNPPQAQLIDAIYKRGEKRHIILKARQMGFSTLIDLMLLDAARWRTNTACAIVDQTQAAASAKLKGKIRFALDKLPPTLRQDPTIANGSEIAFAHSSSIIAGKHVRGGTLQWLHVSEWGPIAHEDPKRSEEIKTGALPAAENGVIIVETTFKGGKGGHLYEMIKAAQETPPEHRTAKDFQFWFFPWYLDAGYTLDGDPRMISREVNDYLDDKQRELNITLTAGQRLWYYKAKAEQGIFMFREYPTTPEEAFMAPVEGAVYGDIISKIRANGQIRDALRDTAFPVYSVWDIGWNDSTSVWLFQIIGGDVHWLWHMRERAMTAADAWHRIIQTGIPISCSILPHDADNTAASTGLSYRAALQNAGATNTLILPRPREIWTGINAARDILHRSYFHKTHCAAGIEALEAYHTRDDSKGGIVSREPVHDWSSHDADAFRYGAEAIKLGLVKTLDARRLNSRLEHTASPRTRHAAADMTQWLRL